MKTAKQWVIDWGHLPTTPTELEGLIKLVQEDAKAPDKPPVDPGNDQRRIIQVSSNLDDPKSFVLGVCDDGTVWKLCDMYSSPRWEKYPAPKKAP